MSEEKPPDAMIAEDFRKILEARSARAHIPVPVAFNYAQAIRLLIKKGYTLPVIAKHIGYANHKDVGQIRDGKKVPDHMAGEALWGKLKDEYPEAFPDALPPEKKRALIELGLLMPAHIKGGKVDFPKRKPAFMK